MTEKTKKHRKRSLLIAAVIYVAGVTALVAGSFIHHKNGHLQQLNTELFGTAAAVRELLSDDIHELQDQGTYLYTKRQQQLKNIAHQGNLALLGALRMPDYAAVMVSDQHFSPPDKLHFLHPEVRDAAKIENQQLTSFQHPELGDLRIAKLIDPESGTIYFSAYDLCDHACLQPGDAMFTVFATIVLSILALPLVLAARQTERLLTMESEANNVRLRQDVSIQQTKEKELREALSDLERFSSVSAGRESRIIELKAEVNELLEQTRMKKRYNIDNTD